MISKIKAFAFCVGMLLIANVSYAQRINPGSDLRYEEFVNFQEALKGDVSAVFTGKVTTVERWGEQVNYMTPDSVCFYTAGNKPILQLVGKFWKLTDYTSDGKIECVYFLHSNQPLPTFNMASMSSSIVRTYVKFLKKAKENYQIRAAYHYGRNGVLEAVVYDRINEGIRMSHKDDRGYDFYHDNSTMDVFKYKGDDYSIYYCDENGETINRIDVLDNGRIKRSNDYEAEFDENGRSISFTDFTVGEKLTFQYNEQGLLSVVENNLTPMTKSKPTIYTYEYDGMGNWVGMEETIGRGITDRESRYIVYTSSRNYGKKLVKRIQNALSGVKKPIY